MVCGLWEWEEAYHLLQHWQCGTLYTETSMLREVVKHAGYRSHRSSSARTDADR